MLIKSKISADTDTTWSRYDSPQSLIDDINNMIKKLKAEDVEALRNLAIMFAPTGALQEISIANGWGDEFLIIAEQFDNFNKNIQQLQ